LFGRLHDSRQILWLHILFSTLLLALLFASRPVFRVRSDAVGFRYAVRMVLIVLAIAFVYGVIGFTLLDSRDFHRTISVATAVHQTLDQFNVTSQDLVACTPRARLFVDSLSMISSGAALYVVVALFQPIRFTIRPQHAERVRAEELLRKHPSDIDDFFKIWPHDKHYFFDASNEAGLAYHVTRGIALVVGDLFGDPHRFQHVCEAFRDFCFVNDWHMAFIHVGPKYLELYRGLGLQAQKIGEEAVLDLESFAERRQEKYFRQISHRFERLGYSVVLTLPPHTTDLLKSTQAISASWLQRPGRAERGFMLGYYAPEYMQRSTIAGLYDSVGDLQGFMNIVPAFRPEEANYDLLRCQSEAPGNSNDFLLLGALDALQHQGVTTLNLGLCPLRGIDQASEESSIIDTALRLLYTNGDRFYSFSGLERFKAKYHPVWHDRFVVYNGGPAGFARTMAALTRAMKVKNRRP
jgi:phosphatidylglycerol lysyltransferase